MKSIFSLGWPEVSGLVVLGGTLGAALCSIEALGLADYTLLGALVGGTCVPAVFMIRWRSLGKVQARKAAAQLQRVR
jgi:uncharacterized MnhB-related membrane protein